MQPNYDTLFDLIEKTCWLLIQHDGYLGSRTLASIGHETIAEIDDTWIIDTVPATTLIDSLPSSTSCSPTTEFITFGDQVLSPRPIMRSTVWVKESTPNGRPRWEADREHLGIALDSLFHMLLALYELEADRDWVEHTLNTYPLALAGTDDSTDLRSPSIEDNPVPPENARLTESQYLNLNVLIDKPLRKNEAAKPQPNYGDYIQDSLDAVLLAYVSTIRKHRALGLPRPNYKDWLQEKGPDTIRSLIRPKCKNQAYREKNYPSLMDPANPQHLIFNKPKDWTHGKHIGIWSLWSD